jgi:hypothetical protein
LAPKGTIIEQAAQAATLIVTKDALNTGQAGKQLQDLQRVRCAWEECQSNRSRDAIYRYLGAVYALVSWWTAEGQEIGRARRALRLSGVDVSDREDPFASVLRCTADPAKADKRTRSKWSRAMRYASMSKPVSEPLDRFVKRKGGINASNLPARRGPDTTNGA